MTGLSVLYASEAAEEQDWAAAPERARTGRLREVYWARRADLKSGREPIVNVTLSWWPDRTEIGRKSDEPGDGFVYLASMVENRFEWIEVTEEFTTVPASDIERAMRAWNGIPDKHPVDFDEFRRALRLGHPSRVEQRRAADRAIERIEKKLAKSSYRELLETYGYGTLVLGMPLWFAVPPDNPFRTENAIDDFMTRITLGLEDLRRRVLRRRDCPFRKVVVIWDTTPEALRQWRDERSEQYEDPGNASLKNPMGVSLWDVISEELEEAVSRTATPESKAPSMRLHVCVESRKKALGTGPYPELVEAFREVPSMRNEGPVGRWSSSRLKVALMLWKLLCFVRIHGVVGLERWIARRLSVSHAWRGKAARRRARRFYVESRRRGRFGGLR